MSEIKERNPMYLGTNDEPPPKKLISDADVLIKELAEKQRNTVTSLQEQLAISKEFTKSIELVPLAKYNPGTSSLKDFQARSKYLDQVEMLKVAGLVDGDIELYFDSLNGSEYLFQKHKNWEESVLKQRLREIQQMLKEYEKIHCSSVTSVVAEPEKNDTVEYGLSVKPNSVETKLLKFALNNEKEKNKLALPHPMDNIKQIEQERFGHLTEISAPSLNKIRRKARKLSNRICNASLAEDRAKTTCIKLNEARSVSNKKESCSLAKRSMWDETEVKPRVQSVENKGYTCLPQNYYTIKDGVIVKLDKDETDRRGLEMASRLSTEEIRMLPKFKDYAPGIPSKVLYIKNLTNSVKEDDLRYIFRNYDRDKNLGYRIMRGKMRGQAFITFTGEDVASRALNDINGTVINNRPMVIQFGCAKK